MAGVVRIICPNLKCRAILSIPESARGMSVRCKLCGTRVTVPAKRAEKQTADVQTDDDAATAETTSPS